MNEALGRARGADSFSRIVATPRLAGSSVASRRDCASWPTRARHAQSECGARMHRIALRLPDSAGVGDDVSLVVHALGNVFPDERKFAGRSRRPLWSASGDHLLQLAELALRGLDPGQ